MNDSPQTDSVELEFSKKYDLKHARQYAAKHESGIFRKLSNWREQAIARNALRVAGNPQVVLDLPCGAGRFWEMLAEEPKRKIFAIDNSEEMIKVARLLRPPEVVERVTSSQGSAFEIKMDNESVQNIFCMRLLHHIGDAQNRALLLKEFHRVTADSVCISLWVDGNRQADRRMKLDAERAQNPNKQKYQNRFVIPALQIEAEFKESGFEVAANYDLLKTISMWRIYVLKKRK